MTSRHQRPPLRRSSAPERILTAGLATATCVGLVGLLGARTIEANTVSVDAVGEPATVSTETVSAPADVAYSGEPTTSTGLTQQDLDAYARELASEKARLDAYRAKLVKTAKKLQRQAQRQASAVEVRQPSAPTVAARPSAGSAPASKPSKPAKAPRPAKTTGAPAAPQQAPSQPQAPAPQQQASKPAPAPAAAPSVKQPPAQQQAAASKPAQSNTKGS